MADEQQKVLDKSPSVGDYRGEAAGCGGRNGGKGTQKVPPFFAREGGSLVVLDRNELGTCLNRVADCAESLAAQLENARETPHGADSCASIADMLYSLRDGVFDCLRVVQVHPAGVYVVRHDGQLRSLVERRLCATVSPPNRGVSRDGDEEQLTRVARARVQPARLVREDELAEAFPHPADVVEDD